MPDFLVRKVRDLPDGSRLEYQERESGWRAYHYRAPGSDKLVRLPSVTTILDEVCVKHALLEWYEERGVIAALTLERAGELDGVPIEDVASLIRERDLGGKASARKAAGRGTTIHAVLQTYMETGDFPNPRELPEEFRGYVVGLAKWLMRANPEPIAIEQIVCSPSYGYAGRYDLRAMVYGQDTLIDLKTNTRCALYREAALQTAAYPEADVECGADPPERHLLVAVGPNGTYVEGRPLVTSVEAWHRALGLYQALKLVEIQPNDSAAYFPQVSDVSGRAA